ncbi:MAG: iron-containing alcohol dehydrogenase [Candidatus Rokubacteria bacterium]|nr:iron-containing alcohol dehydrogenase [Candidatus Rokubacteria bacterium]
MRTAGLLTETIIPMETVPIKFGVGATEELGYELKRLGARRILLVADPGLREAGLTGRVQEIMEGEGLQVALYEKVHVEPTDHSIQEAVEAARQAGPEAFVALGGGSTIDTAKAMNLFTTHPAPLTDYLNRPVGQGKPVPGPLKPLVAIPTTAGTGSESTPVLVLDLLAMKLKTGISHRYLRPSLALIDPLNTVSMPAAVTAASGCDVLSHAIESFTARPYHTRPRPASPAERPGYIGSNPISDLWSEKAIELCGRYLRQAVLNGYDLEARTAMLMASTFAGIGFGNAGVHIPHAVAYPIAGLARDYVPSGYKTRQPLVPHGMSVILTAPAAFRFTYASASERHLRAAELMGMRVTDLGETERREALPRALVTLMRDIGIPNGLTAIGYTERDIPALVEGTLRQPRLLAGAPRQVGTADLDWILRDAMRCW